MGSPRVRRTASSLRMKPAPTTTTPVPWQAISWAVKCGHGQSSARTAVKCGNDSRSPPRASTCVWRAAPKRRASTTAQTSRPPGLGAGVVLGARIPDSRAGRSGAKPKRYASSSGVTNSV